MKEVARGARLAVFFAKDAQGRYPAEKFLEDLVPENQREVASIAHLLQVFADKKR